MLPYAKLPTRSGEEPEKERKAAGKRYQEASTQMDLLLNEEQGINSDFETYRYLASQGFLPATTFRVCHCSPICQPAVAR